MIEILVTGGTGLIGSRLIPELIERDHTITELRRYNSSRGLQDNYEYRDVVWYDMRGGGRLPDRTFDLVIHLAAMASNEIANKNPVECFDIIAMGTQRLMEDLRGHGNPIIVLASSSEVIGNEVGGRFARNPYAAAKIAAEEIVRASGYRWVVTRPYNTYGRALIGAPVAVIDKWIVATLEGFPLERWPNSPVRDFLWREDHVSAYLALIEVLEKHPDSVLEQPIPFGTGQGHQVNAVLPMIANRLGADIIDVEQGRANDTPYLVAETASAEVLLDWKSKVSLVDGIDLAIEEWQMKRWEVRKGWTQTKRVPSATS